MRFLASVASQRKLMVKTTPHTSQTKRIPLHIFKSLDVPKIAWGIVKMTKTACRMYNGAKEVVDLLTRSLRTKCHVETPIATSQTNSTTRKQSVKFRLRISLRAAIMKRTTKADATMAIEYHTAISAKPLGDRSIFAERFKMSHERSELARATG
jgi:hypothetical protein